MILTWYPEQRFWPRHVHLLRSITFPHVRFYSLGGIQRKLDVAILLAHFPPPHSYQLEKQTLAQVQSMCMAVLREMFAPQSLRSTAVAADFLVDIHDTEPTSAKLRPRQCSDEDKAAFSTRTAEYERQLATRREERLNGDRQWTGEGREDNAWRSKPVVLPHSIEVTRWREDPFALGAYSYGQCFHTSGIATALKPVCLRLAAWS